MADVGGGNDGAISGDDEAVIRGNDGAIDRGACPCGKAGE